MPDYNRFNVLLILKDHMIFTKKIHFQQRLNLETIYVQRGERNMINLWIRTDVEDTQPLYVIRIVLYVSHTSVRTQRLITILSPPVHI